MSAAVKPVAAYVGRGNVRHLLAHDRDRNKPALCGVRTAHGWFETPATQRGKDCARCALAKAGQS